MAVVFFHYAPGRLPGGFVGVDIFFVISGYLITGILAKAFANHSFSLLYFYERRIRRIFPGLILILALCLVVGWLCLFPSEYAEVGKHIAAGAGYIQNFALWAQAGYFDTDAIQKPLLHLWSLAVEEQFYILWPLILWVVMRRRWPVLTAIAAIAALSFALNIWHVTGGHDTTAFYWPTTRAWELMIGAWLAMSHRQHRPGLQRAASLQAWLGLALILVGIAVIRPEHFPGFWALLPTVGTALIINAGPGRLVNRLFSLKPVVWLSLISYPLYLWHWVLWSLINIVMGDLETWTARAIKVVLFLTSVLLAWLTYQYFEKPVRRRGGNRVTLSLFLAVAVLGLAGLGTWLANGLANRPLTPVNMSAESYFTSAVRSPKESKCYSLNHGSARLPAQWNCVVGDPTANTTIIATGDSHSFSMLPALVEYGHKHHVKVIYAGISSCVSLLGVIKRDPRPGDHACVEMAKKIKTLAANQSISAIVIIQRWGALIPGAITRPEEGKGIRILDTTQDTSASTGVAALKHGLKKTLNYYQSLDIPVVLMEDNPQQINKLVQSVPRFGNRKITDADINATAVTLKQHIADQATVNHILESIAAQYPHVTTPSINSALCRDGICPWVVDGKLLYFNDDHLSITGALQVYPALEKHLNQVLGLDGSGGN